MTWFFLWKGEKESRARLYDCDHCCAMKLIDSRVCYRYNEIDIVEVPAFSDGERQNETRKESLSGNQVVEELTLLLEEVKSSDAVFLSFQRLFPKVCPIGIAIHEDELLGLIALESKSSRYHSPPAGPTLLDWPNRLSRFFDLIAEARNDFYAWRVDQMGNK